MWIRQSVSNDNDAHLMSFVSGTGDHSFERRLRLGGPLLKENIATMVLERLTFN